MGGGLPPGNQHAKRHTDVYRARCSSSRARPTSLARMWPCTTTPAKLYSTGCDGRPGPRRGPVQTPGGRFTPNQVRTLSLNIGTPAPPSLSLSRNMCSLTKGNGAPSSLESGSHWTHRWRKPDSNRRSRPLRAQLARLVTRYRVRNVARGQTPRLTALSPARRTIPWSRGPIWF